MWNSVICSDETKTKCSVLRHIRNTTNTAHHSEKHHPQNKHGGGSIMQWGCFFFSAETRKLVRVEGKIERAKCRNTEQPGEEIHFQVVHI